MTKSTAAVFAAVLACSVQAFAAEPAKGNPDAARSKVSMCIGCHGIPMYHTAFPTVYHVPYIAGQQPQYIMQALKEYRAGERNHPSMQGIAKSLSDQDIADLAAYYGASKEAAPR